MTDAERSLWAMLREHFAGFHFRSQVPVRHYIANFASHRAKLIIEVDGGQHSTEKDAVRTTVIEQEGYRVIRFWNDEVLSNREGVYRSIESDLRDHHPHPASPIKGEEF